MFSLFCVLFFEFCCSSLSAISFTISLLFKNFILPKNKGLSVTSLFVCFSSVGKVFFPFVFLSDNITDLQLAVDNSVLLVTENILGCKLLVDLAGLLLSEWRTQDTFATMLTLKTLRLSYFIEGFTWESNAWS